MSRPLKIILVAVGVVISLLACVAVALLVFDPEAHKSRAEAAASASIGMDVSVEGQILVDFFPVHVTLHAGAVPDRGVLQGSVAAQGGPGAG